MKKGYSYKAMENDTAVFRNEKLEDLTNEAVSRMAELESQGIEPILVIGKHDMDRRGMIEGVKSKIDQLEIAVKYAVNKHVIEKEIQYWKGVLWGIEIANKEEVDK